MLRLLNPNSSPVGGFRFVDPDTDFIYNRPYRNFEELESHVQEYRSQNKLLPIDHFREVWENWICQEFGMEKNCCLVSEDIKRTFEQYIKGAKVYVRSLFKKEKFVSQEEANRRASICADCTQNLVNIGHRMSQFYTDRFMRHQTAGRSTPFDAKLYTCKICTCLLRSKVHYSKEEVANSLTDTEVGKLLREPRSITSGQPIKCWQAESVEQNK